MSCEILAVLIKKTVRKTGQRNNICEDVVGKTAKRTYQAAEKAHSLQFVVCSLQALESCEAKKVDKR